MQILHEDNHLLVVAKPAGIPTQGARPNEPSVVAWAKQYVKERYQKPGNVYIGVVSRLDRVVSGAVLLARTSKAAARLSEALRRREVDKTYWALTRGPVEPAEGSCVDWLVKDESRHRMRIVPRSENGLQAELHYRTLAQLPRATLLEIKLITGRKHQIRLQLASRGWPIVGDRKYGSQVPFVRDRAGDAIALHSRSIRFRHPVRGDEIAVVAPLPAAWRAWGCDDRRAP